MFDQILQMVKEHMSNNPQVMDAIPIEKSDAVHQEIATHLTEGIKSQAVTQGGTGGLLSSLESEITSGNPIANAIEGGLVASLASKFGLPPVATGAIAASLPGLLQKFAHKTSDPNDSNFSNLPGGNSGSGGLGNLLGKL